MYEITISLNRIVVSTETREGWPLLIVETEVNGDSKSTNLRGSFLGWFVGLQPRLL
jgi:hypothetical protein